MTVRGPNSIKPPLNCTPESSVASKMMSKKTQQNGLLQSNKKSSNQKSNIVEPSVSILNCLNC